MTDNQRKTLDLDANLAEDVENFRLSRPEISAIEITTVRGTRLRFPEANQAAPSFVPDQPPKEPFCKPYRNGQDLVGILRDRGLEIPDVDTAVTWLDKIGYYRFTGYALSFRLTDQSGKPVDLFRPQTRFEDVIDLYEFDRHLRLLILDAIERIEVAFRSRLNDVMSSLHDPHWFMKTGIFSEKTDKKTGEPIFNHAEFLAKATEEARRSKESLPVRHYYSKYSGPSLPPCWMLAEVLSMGTWSKAFGMLSDRADQKAVAATFRASPPEFASWIHALTNLRNTCAHHNRLWDRAFVARPSKKGNLKNVLDSNERLFAQLATVLYCLWSVEPESSWLERLAELLSSHPTVPHSTMGFPPDWQARLAGMKSS